MTDTNILICEDLIAGYGDTIIVNDVSLSVAAGEMLAVVGPNGAGKSTLIKAVSGLLKPRDGRITLNGEDISAWVPHRRALAGVAYVPQVRNVFAELMVWENLRLGVQHLPRRDRAAAIERVLDLFPELAGFRNSLAGDLSGGQRQMLTISRALLLGPSLLVVDEPTAGLSPLFSQMVFEKLEAVRATGTAILMVEQDIDLALKSADRVMVLETGKTVFDGLPCDLLEDQKLVQLYLGG